MLVGTTKYFNCVAFLLFSIFGSAQSGFNNTSNKSSEYFEDQFYIGLGYNFLLEKPSDVVQRSLSYNLQTGFIKDIPFNQRRNFGIGIGLGYATNSYYSNIVASEVGNNIVYRVSDTSDFERNKLETHAIEIPLELRWRTSTADEYKFWRIYAGAKLGYVFSGSSRMVSDTNTMRFSNDDIQSFQYGLQLNFGYNTWNVQAYYSLNPLLEDGTALETGEAIDIRVLRIGIIFYIL
ncbi:porin family protein [Flagellimonas sp. CMM7]|uniref:porin family protein n=1 Tax=Flagellimonas sp. CMM7 TaxID=2654676 RepID=UPI0013D3384E|nr:porin family protein [Flagellimonas sp. CMM7]UII80910.1 PorT family protein [Flagellimonas sp. CMM7]